MAKLKYIFFIISAILWSYSVEGQIPDKPNQLVNDYSDVLETWEEDNLEKKLKAFNDTTSTQIVIVIIDDMMGYDVSALAIEIGEQWGVGQEGKDNGIVILIKPTGREDQREAFISVGYGLEPIVPDIVAGEIVDYEMIPAFKEGEFYSGLDNATDVLIQLTSGEFSASDYSEKQMKEKRFGIILFLIMMGFFFVGLPLIRTFRYAKTNNLGLIAAFTLMTSNSRRGNSGGWGHFSGGSGSFGGGSSGFGGFGGGSFGGGGAGGSW